MCSEKQGCQTPEQSFQSGQKKIFCAFLKYNFTMINWGDIYINYVLPYIFKYIKTEEVKTR